MATIKDIARELELSASTVSRALNDNPQISPATRQRVREVAARIGYRLNVQASALRTGRTNVVGLVVANIRNPFFNVLAFEIEKAATELGYSLMLANSNEDARTQEAAIQTMLDHHIDGLLIVPVGQPSQQIAKSLMGKPVVSIDRAFEDGRFTCPSVVSNSHQAVEELVSTMVAKGYQRPLFVCGPQDTTTGAERRASLEIASEAAGFSAAEFVESAFDEEAGRQAVAGVLERGITPDIVVCASGQIAVGALGALATQGIVVGRDVGFATFDDLDWLRVFQPPITVVDTHVPQLARAAMEMLYQSIEEKAARGFCPPSDDRVEVPASLITRDSV